jgi:hypothetical protein
MARRKPCRQALAQIRHGIGTGDAERLEAETARARLDGLA